MSQYEDIARRLRGDIKDGTFEIGDALPAESELAQWFSVSVPTMRSALAVLQNEGLIEKQHGSGNYVRNPLDRIVYAAGGGIADHGAASDTDLEVKVSGGGTAADEPVAARLRVPVGTPLTEFAYVSRRGRYAYSLTRIYVPCAVAVVPVPKTSVSPFGEDIRAALAALGVHPASTVERFTARMPKPSEARELKISAVTAVLSVERTCLDAEGRVTEAVDLVMPGHRSVVVSRTGRPAEEAASR